MTALIYTAILLLILLFYYYFISKKTARIVVKFGLFVGTFILGLYFFISSCFGASTPINILVKNHTNQKIKIYTIVFWKDPNNNEKKYTYYNVKLNPNQSSIFCIENDGGKFWLIAINEQKKISYLKEVTAYNYDMKFNIKTLVSIDTLKSKIAKEAISAKDIEMIVETALIYFNLFLIAWYALLNFNYKKGNLTKLKSILHKDSVCI